MVWSINSSIREIWAGLSQGDILRSLVGNNTPIRVEIPDAIGGDSGNDLVLGGSQDDLLIGDVGDDSIYGSGGNDTVYGGTSHLIVEDWEGQDLLVGGSGDDLIFGNQGDDTLYGSEGDDTLYGGKDSDLLYGNSGNNVLFGDLGSDTLFGGEGENRFQIGRRFDVPGFQSTGGQTLADADWIMDFSPGKDLIELQGGLTFDDLNILAGTGENTGDTILQDKVTQEYLAIVKNIRPEAIARNYFWPSSQEPPASPLPTQNPQEDTNEAVDQIPSSDSVAPDEQIITPDGEQIITPDEEKQYHGTIAFNGIRYNVLEDKTRTREITLVRQDGDDGKVSVTVTLIKGTEIVFPNNNNPAIIVTFAPGETEKIITIPIGEDDAGETNTTFSIVLSDPTGGAAIALTHPIVVTLPTQNQPGSIIFGDDNVNGTEEENEAADLEPDTSSEIEEEPADLEPDTSSEIEKEPEEIEDTEPDTSSEIEEEPADLEPDTSSEIEEEPADLEPDTSSEIEEEPEEPADLEPDTSSEIEEEPEEPADLEPDTSSEIEEEPEEIEDTEPDTSSEIEEEPEEIEDTEPDTSSEIEEEPEEIEDTEPDTSSEIEEEPEDTEPDTSSEENEIPPIEEEDGEDTNGEIEDEPLDEDGDNSSGDESEISAPANYADAASGIIADLSKGIVTRLFTTSADVPFKILPLGDSNTRGFPNQASIGGYRARLWEKLVGENGFNIDFVGQASSGPTNIDINHEGRGGFTINELINNNEEFSGYNQPNTPPYTTIENALKDQPNAILLMAGTNDILQGDAAEIAIADLEVLVDRITETLPEAQVLVASIIPHISSNSDRQQRTKEFSEQVYEFVVAPRATTNPNIRFVDMFNTPLVSSDYSSDGIHLNASGYDKLADEWYSQIRMLPSGEETLTDVQNIIGSAYDDTLIGNDRSNEIQGGGGNDWLIGGAGEDTFILAQGEGTDTIADFESGIDRLGLSDGLEFEQLTISTGSAASDTHIAIADSGESLATLMGIDASTISADDFILV